jgi:hypothetical protein
VPRRHFAVRPPGPGLTPLATPDADASDLTRLRRQAADCGVPLVVLQPQEGGVANLYPNRYTLVRPDQHVAWRADRWPADGAALLRRVCGQAA